MANSTAINAKEFVELSRRAESCAVLVSTLRSTAETGGSISTIRNAATVLARALSDSRSAIPQYEDILAGLGELSDALLLAGQTYESGHAAAFQLAHSMIHGVWLATDQHGMPLGSANPLKSEHIRINRKTGEIESRQPAPFDPDRLLCDEIDNETLDDVRHALSLPCYQFSSDILISRIRRERPRVVERLGVNSAEAGPDERKEEAEAVRLDGVKPIANGVAQNLNAVDFVACPPLPSADVRRFFLHYPAGHRLYICIVDDQRRPFDFTDNCFKPASQLSCLGDACLYASGAI